MRRPGLKSFRVAAAVVCLVLATAALVDFRGIVSTHWAHAITSIQFVPSSVALVTGAAASVACVVVLAVTLLFGRVYCSVLCPLGVFQDVVWRIRQWVAKRTGSRKPVLLRHEKPATPVRHLFFWAVVASILVGWGGLGLALLDPYSVYGRMVVDLFRPLAIAANNAAVTPAEALGWEGLYRVPLRWAAAGALAAPVIMLLVVAGLAAWRGRLYCNTVCPVGTLLGWVSRWSAFRIQFDRDACSKCAACLQACKAQCLDLRRGEIDFSRCVACYDCLPVCDDAGIGYRWAWGRKARPQPRKASAPAGASDPVRRTVVGGMATGLLGVVSGAGRARAQEDGADPYGMGGSPAAVASDVRHATNEELIAAAGIDPGKVSRVMCPPGARSVERFIDRCTACHLCVSACPTGVLQPAVLEYGLAGMLNPRMDYEAAFCNFDCRRCAEVCPDHAIELLDVEAKHRERVGVAVLDLETCIVKSKGTDCAACSEHCPTKAVDTIPYLDNLRLPRVEPEYCIGCGACEFACPTRPVRAIRVIGLREHEQAEKKVEKKLETPSGADDFPF